MLSKYKEQGDRIFGGLGRALGDLGLTPNMITFLSFICATLVGVAFALKFLLLAGLLTILTGFFDVLDGVTARVTKQTTKFGGVFDSILDRYSEVIIFAGIIWYGVNWIIGLLALAGSLLVSYTRAKGEILGIQMSGVGFAERLERLILLALGAITAFLIPQVFGFLTLGLFVVLIALLSHITALHRFFYIWQQLKKQ
ncbi:MAG: CDP-alcohol phosphatidyltransferase family protein [Euryarchaeota archaeon]|nr:CDP-alcohol phosphatidyltransferase family protein [Euryarchaeota archaeon]